MDTVKDAVQLKFENPGDKDSEVVKMLPKGDTVPETKEKIREFDRLFALEERWSGQLECYYMSLYQRYQEKYGDGEMSLEKLKEYLEEDIKRNQIIQNWQPGRYLGSI